jgi:RimJ/RimL family protein N-acetyltransferase
VIPPILTPRLALVSLSPQFLRASLAGQLDAAAALLGAELPLEWPRGHEPLLQRRLTQLEADPAAQPWLLRAILPRTDRVLIGLIGFHAPPDSTGTVEIGYRVEPAFRGHGYATEAVRALFAWATQTQGIHKFRASVSPSNKPSLRLITRLGSSRQATSTMSSTGWSWFSSVTRGHPSRTLRTKTPPDVRQDRLAQRAACGQQLAAAHPFGEHQHLPRRRLALRER